MVVVYSQRQHMKRPLIFSKDRLHIKHRFVCWFHLAHGYVNQKANVISDSTPSFYPFRGPCSAGGAAQVFGPAVRAEGAAASGPAGLLSKEGRNWDGLQPQPGEAGWKIPHKDAQHQGPSTQVWENHTDSTRSFILTVSLRLWLLVAYVYF